MRRQMGLAGALAMAMLWSSGPAALSAPAPPTNRLVTHQTGQPFVDGADGSIAAYSMSADGSKIAFEFSHTNDGDPNDDLISFFTDNTGGSFPSIFLYDRDTGLVAQVSYAHNSIDKSDTVNSNSQGPIVSADGNWVVFRTSATDVIEDFVNSINAFNAVYIRNINTGQVLLVNHAAGLPLAESDGSPAGNVAVSADGSRVAYRSVATDIITGFDHENDASEADVYLWDRSSNTNTLVSHSHEDPLQGSDNAVDQFSETSLQISADGRYVTYTSEANNLVPNFVDNNASLEDIYLYDAVKDTNTLVSHGASATEGSDGDNKRPVLASNGSRVAYESTSSNLVSGFVDNNAGDGDVFVWSRSSNSTRLVSFSAENGKKEGASPSGGFNGSAPQISANGKAIAYESDANDLMRGFVDAFNGQDEIWLWTETMKNGRKVFKNTLITHKFDDRKTSHFLPVNHMTALSANGKAVVFQSGDTTTVLDGFVNGNGSNHDIYVYSTKTKRATLVSRSISGPLNGSNGSNGAFAPTDTAATVVSRDGKIVVFTSASTDLVGSFTQTNAALNDFFVFGPTPS